MRIILIFILGILLHAPLHAQPKMDSSLVYIHHDKPSFKSQFFQKVASVFGVKNLIEKSIIKGKYDQEVAPIPKSVIKNSGEPQLGLMATSIKDNSRIGIGMVKENLVCLMDTI